MSPYRILEIPEPVPPARPAPRYEAPDDPVEPLVLVGTSEHGEEGDEFLPALLAMIAALGGIAILLAVVMVLVRQY
jgi:hypothetical protein